MSYQDKIRNKQNITNAVDEDERMSSYDDVSDNMLAKQVQEAEQEAHQIVKTGMGTLDLTGFHADAAGLEILAGTPFDDIKQSADWLFKMQSHIQIWIGDLLNSVDDLKYGEITKLAEQYNIEPTTLHKWKSIASNVTLFLRRNVLIANPNKKPLTKSHYELVMALDESEQERLLMEASANEWSVAKLRRQLPRNEKSSKPIGFNDVEPKLKGVYTEVIRLKGDDRLKALNYLKNLVEILEQS